MPKETFYNLKDDKKQKIFAAAVQEFSSSRFNEASINQIIKHAEISRGSFYQYFNDKEDIYLYMISEIGKEKLAVINEARRLEPDADFFQAFLHMTETALTWAKAMPQYNEIGMRMAVDDSEFIMKLRALSPEGTNQLKEMITRDQQRGLIKATIDADLVIEMILTMMLHLLIGYYRTGKYEEMFTRAKVIIDIIKNGIAASEEG
ncbi:MAG: TetR/AcrR family transcriptional regulator [Firmicutes bacterium]|nr:TetR/AcrR family transcriptional regulator [Bacillota bacterium]